MWITRKKVGLAQKQVAFLLGHKNTTQLSRYEHGTRIPSLKTALKLEIAYAKPLRLLFFGLHDELREDVQKRREKIFVYKELKEN
ncbi:MAG TPA: helix-turn-helix domain-containing protein [Candidatus Brocadiia bacterium]